MPFIDRVNYWSRRIDYDDVYVRLGSRGVIMNLTKEELREVGTAMIVAGSYIKDNFPEARFYEDRQYHFSAVYRIMLLTLIGNDFYNGLTLEDIVEKYSLDGLNLGLELGMVMTDLLECASVVADEETQQLISRWEGVF